MGLIALAIVNYAAVNRGFADRKRRGCYKLVTMRPRTKIEIPNPSGSEFENFDRFVRIVLAKGKPQKHERPKAKPQDRKRLPRP